MKKLRGYIFSRTFLGERLPQHIQNLVLRDYCERNSCKFLLSAVEYAMPNSDLILFGILYDMNSIDGILAYSIFQLPVDDIKRFAVYRKIIDSNKILCFALEDLVIQSLGDLEKVETLFLLRKNI